MQSPPTQSSLGCCDSHPHRDTRDTEVLHSYDSPSLYEFYVIDGIFHQQFSAVCILWMLLLIRAFYWGVVAEPTAESNTIQAANLDAQPNTRLGAANKTHERAKENRTLVSLLGETKRVLST
jgi:hypothetical protein